MKLLQELKDIIKLGMYANGEGKAKKILLDPKKSNAFQVLFDCADMFNALMPDETLIAGKYELSQYTWIQGLEWMINPTSVKYKTGDPMFLDLVVRDEYKGKNYSPEELSTAISELKSIYYKTEIGFNQTTIDQVRQAVTFESALQDCAVEMDGVLYVPRDLRAPEMPRCVLKPEVLAIVRSTFFGLDVIEHFTDWKQFMIDNTGSLQKNITGARYTPEDTDRK